MTEFRYDHVHLRSPDPEATAAWYAKMFGAEIVRSVMTSGIERTDIKLAGVNHFIAKVPDSAELAEKP
ncbi:MAG TPA: VOC family protein, partial [Stellaceae bacterium]|nr:VOC family protein [Stellaceae bacterium]